MPLALMTLVDWGQCSPAEVAGITHWLRGSLGFEREDGVRVAMRFHLLKDEFREVEDHWRIWGN